MARALAADPPVMLMDEPFGAIDPITRARLQDEFLRILHDLKKTIVFVTHDIDEAIRMGDRIAILRDGALVQYDTPEAILARPADAFVEAFVGTDRALKRLALIRRATVSRAADRRRACPSCDRRRGEPARCAVADVLRGRRRARGHRPGRRPASGIVTLTRIRQHVALRRVEPANRCRRHSHRVSLALNRATQFGSNAVRGVADRALTTGSVRT